MTKPGPTRPWKTSRTPARSTSRRAANALSPLAAAPASTARRRWAPASPTPRAPLASLKGLLHVRRKIPYLIAIPTTAGTGSEATLSAVVTDPAQKHKYTMNNFTFIPSCAVLDPQVTFSLPPALTATTGMDALTHAVEAYIGTAPTGKPARWPRMR